MAFENSNNFNKFSFTDIVSRFVKENIAISKLFFKVQNNISKISQTNIKQKISQNDINNENSMSPFYTPEGENYWKNKLNEMDEVEYFEFEMKKLNNSNQEAKS